MAKAPAKAGKKKTFKKKEKRLCPRAWCTCRLRSTTPSSPLRTRSGTCIAWSSSGSLGFRGSRKGTPFAAQQASLTAANKAKESGLRIVEVNVSGPGAGRESAVRALATAGLEVRTIKDKTPIPHNGCRPPKKRRV